MSDFVRPDSLNWTCILNQTSALPPPLFGPPVFPLLRLVPVAVAGAVVVAIWVWRNPALLLGHLLDRADQILAIAVEEQPQPRAFRIPPIPGIAVEKQPQPRGLQIQPIPAIAVEEQLPERRPSWIVFVWDASQVAAAIRAFRDYMEERIPRIARQARMVDSIFDSDSDYDSDGSRSTTSGDERREYVRYPSLDHLEVGVCLVVPNSMARLQQMLRGLPEAQRQETIRRACPRMAAAEMNVAAEMEEQSVLKRKSEDVGWEYGVLVDAGNMNKVKCLLCGHVSTGGIHRLKQHVAHVGNSVAKCKESKNRPGAQDKCKKSLDEAKRKRMEKTARELNLREDVNVSRVEGEAEDEVTCVGSSEPHKLGSIDK